MKILYFLFFTVTILFTFLGLKMIADIPPRSFKCIYEELPYHRVSSILETVDSKIASPIDCIHIPIQDCNCPGKNPNAYIGYTYYLEKYNGRWELTLFFKKPLTDSSPVSDGILEFTPSVFFSFFENKKKAYIP